MKTKTLFVLPSYAPQPFITPIYPGGALLVATYIKKQGFEIVPLNLNMHSSRDMSDVLCEYITQYDINVLAVGGLYMDYMAIENILTVAKVTNPRITTIVGGGLVTCEPELIMDGIPAIDFGIIGEGEITTAELLATLEKDVTEQNLNDIDGLIYRDGATLIKTQPRAEIVDLDTLPYPPDYDSFQIFEQIDNLGITINDVPFRSAYIISSRSCPGKCTFCSLTSGRKYRQRSMSSIFAEIDILVEQYNITMLFMVDELFAQKRERVIEFCSRIEPYNLKWIIQIRADSKLNFDDFMLMKKCGCIQITFGAESMDDNVLKSMNKHTTAKQNEKMFYMLEQTGIAFSGSFIFGDVAETKETAEKTIAWWTKHQEIFNSSSQSSIAPLYLFPGSKLYQDACASGKISNPLEFIKQGCPLINISKLSDEEYNNLVLRLQQLKHNRFDESDPHQIIYNDVLNPTKYSFVCKSCGSHNTDCMYTLATRKQMCRNCCYLHTFNFIEYNKETISEGFRNLKSNGKLAVWGIGLLWKRLRDVTLLPCDYADITLIDQDKKKQGEHGDTFVYDSDVLKDEDFKTVIVTAPQNHFLNIKSFINDRYAHIEKVVDGNDIFRYI